MANTIPVNLKKYFWDTDIKNIKPKKHQKYIIARLLERGNKEAFRYVIRNFPKSTITQTIKTSREFSPRSASFWAAFFGINKKEVLRLQKASTRKPASLWPH